MSPPALTSRRLFVASRGTTAASRRAGACATGSAPEVKSQQYETPSKGRGMLATVAFGKGEVILRERPVVRGRCTATGCPGCPSALSALNPVGAAHAPDCFWALVERQPRLKPAVEWFRSVCESYDTQPESYKANHARICCLLAICIQATASASLRSWIRHALRPSVVDKDDPSSLIVKNTHGFALKFSIKIPPPAEAESAFAPPLSAAAWQDELFHLLLNLQTNLFELDRITIGIFPSGFLYEHACRPNSAVRAPPPSAALLDLDRPRPALTALDRP